VIYLSSGRYFGACSKWYFGNNVADPRRHDSHLLGIGRYLAGFISSKRSDYRLLLAGFKEVIPDISLLIPVHIDADVAQPVLGDVE